MSNEKQFFKGYVTKQEAINLAVTFGGSGGGGDVVGPASATNNNVAIFDQATGKLIKDSGKNLNSKFDVTGGTISGSVTVIGNAQASGFTDTNYTGGKFLATNNSKIIVSALSGGIITHDTLVAGSDYVFGSYSAVPLTGGNGTDATADIEVDNFGLVISVNIVNSGINYKTGDTLSASNADLGGSGSGFSINVASIFYEPLIKKSGATIQTVSSSTGDLVTISTTPLPVDDSIPLISEGEEVLICTITCEDTNNKLFIQVNSTASTNPLRTNGFAVFQNGVTEALAAIPVTSNSNDVIPVSFSVETGAVGTTSPVTISLRAGNSDASALYINGASASRLFGGKSLTTLTVSEIKA